MNRQEAIRAAVKGTSDYHSLMRSVLINIVPQQQPPNKSELDKFDEIQFFKRSSHAARTPINRYTKIAHLENGVLVESVAWIHAVTLSSRLKMCHYCEDRIYHYLQTVSPSLWFRAYLCEDDFCELCGAYEPQENYGDE